MNEFIWLCSAGILLALMAENWPVRRQIIVIVILLVLAMLAWLAMR